MSCRVLHSIDPFCVNDAIGCTTCQNTYIFYCGLNLCTPLKAVSSQTAELPSKVSYIYITTDGQSASLSWCHAPVWDPRTNFLISLIIFRQLRVCWCWAPSLTRSRVRSFQLLLGIANTVFLGSESHGTHEHILFSIFETPPTWRARNRVAQLYPRALGSLCPINSSWVATQI
jgi:hypothetical protein